MDLELIRSHHENSRDTQIQYTQNFQYGNFTVVILSAHFSHPLTLDHKSCSIVSSNISIFSPSLASFSRPVPNPTTRQLTLHQLTTMDAFADSGELYTIRNQFYTNQHRKIQEYSLDQFPPENQLKVLEYKIRSAVALEEDASQLIDSGKSLFPNQEGLFQLLSAWNDLKSFGTDDLTYFDDIKLAQFELQAVLTAIYRVKFEKDVELAINILTSYIDNLNNFNELEPFLVLVQLHLATGNLQAANKVMLAFQKFPDSARDSIVYQVLESWILAIKGESDNISNAYYFYDELLSADFDNDPQGKFKLLNMLFVLTLQMKHYPEVQELLVQLKDLNITSGDFIANQITFDYLTNGGAQADELRSQLAKVDPEHQCLAEFQEKNAQFDDIVKKYQTT